MIAEICGQVDCLSAEALGYCSPNKKKRKQQVEGDEHPVHRLKLITETSTPVQSVMIPNQCLGMAIVACFRSLA